MGLSSEFLDAAAAAASRRPGSRVIPWPVPGNLGALISFDTFAEWRTFWLQFTLPSGVPQKMVEGFERAQKLYLLAWIDVDLVIAGELAALATLEHVLRDRYLGKEKQRRSVVIREKSALEKRQPTEGEFFWADRVSFADLLKHMVERDHLTDDKLGFIRRCGGSAIGLLTGQRDPSLADIRNARAHGDPFNSGFEAGLIELVRDLIVYAYRDLIAGADSGAA